MSATFDLLVVSMALGIALATVLRHVLRSRGSICTASRQGCGSCAEASRGAPLTQLPRRRR